MARAPNETEEQYARKNELFRLKETRALSMQELYELRDLTRNATSHLVFATHPRKETQS
jgi:hypothetical protein